MRPKKSVILDSAGKVMSGKDSGVQFNPGGIASMMTGIGGMSDKGDSSQFTPTLIFNRLFLETIYAESWAAARFVNMPIDDMFIKWRKFLGDDEKEIAAIEKAERELKCRNKLSQAMKAARLHGSGYAVMFTMESSLDKPLQVESIKEGDFKALHCFDRYDMIPVSWVSDLFSPDYGKPEIYSLQPKLSTQQYLIHSSRVLQFDGQKAINSDGWDGYYNHDSGLSELVPAIRDILHDAGLVAAVSHLAQEASIPIIKIHGFSDSATTNYTPADEATVEQIGTKISVNKSIYKTLFLDKDDDFDRSNIPFAGLSDLIEKSMTRLAAIAGIPATRFLSKSPDGMNSTGDSDNRNYAMEVASKQEKMLTEPLMLLDQILSRHAGLGGEVPQYEWRMLTDMSDKEQAEIAKLRADAFKVLIETGAVDEDEIRENITAINDPVLGKYEGSIDQFGEREALENAQEKENGKTDPRPA